MSETQIPFKGFSLGLHPLLAASHPLMEALLEDLIGNWVQVDRRVLYNALSLLKPSHFQSFLQLGEQRKVKRSHFRRTWNLPQHRNVVFAQELLNQIGRIDGALSWWSCHYSFAQRCSYFHRITKTADDLQVISPLLYLDLVVRNHGVPPHGSQRTRLNCFDLATYLCLVVSCGRYMFPLWRLVLSENTRLITSNHCVEKVRVAI